MVAVCLTAVLIVAIPAFQELARAARSVEKLADLLSRELPPTLEAIRLTGLELSDLTDEVSEGVKSAGRVVKNVDLGLNQARQQVYEVQRTTRSFLAGAKAAWQSFQRSRGPSQPTRKRRRFTAARSQTTIALPCTQPITKDTHPLSTNAKQLLNELENELETVSKLDHYPISDEPLD